MPPMAVEATRVFAGEYKVRHRIIANVKPYRQITLLSRVSGFLTERNFTEGSCVRKGTVLYRVERTPYELAVKRAEADLAQARARALDAELEYKRAKELYEAKIAPQKRYDNARASLQETAASVHAAEAALGNAELNRSYTEIVAPFDGWIGLTRTDVGNYLSAPSEPLAVLSDLEQVRVEFNVSDAYLTGTLRNDIGFGKNPDWNVMLRFQNGEAYPHLGKIRFWQNQIERDTATLTMQAVFPNKEHKLLPGQFVLVELENPVPQKVLLADRAALRSNQGREFVLVITPEQTVEFRPVETGETVGNNRIIRAGLKEGEQLALAGNALIRPGMKIRISPRSVNQNAGRK